MDATGFCRFLLGLLLGLLLGMCAFSIPGLNAGASAWLGAHLNFSARENATQQNQATAQLSQLSEGLGPEAESPEPPSSPGLKVAVYMTTHKSPHHMGYLPCWQRATQQLPLLRDADLILYTSRNFTEKELSLLTFRQTVIKPYTPKVYQQGAMQAVKDGFGYRGHNESWFRGYDWVIRLNPDALIVHDEWLRETMLNESVDGIFVECPSGINTDFFAVRPNKVMPEAVQNCKSAKQTVYAETHWKCCIRNILDAKRYVLLPGVNPHRKIPCKVSGNHSPVVHAHRLSTCCPDYFSAAGGSDDDTVHCEKKKSLL